MEYINRKPWIAVFLTFLLPGTGHLYCGAVKRSLAIYVIIIGVINPLSSLIWLIPYENLNIIVYLALLFLLYFLIVRDAVLTAQKSEKPYKLRKYNRVYVYIFLIVLSSFVVKPIIKYPYKNFIVRAYRLPSMSMKPTLLMGDHIITNLMIYKYGDPQRGDIIVFRTPNDNSKDFVKRIVAVGGDVLEIREKKVILNGQQLEENYVTFTDSNIYGPDENPRDFLGPITISMNSYFVLGDNRDNSFDSRYFGLVHKKLIKGKVISIYFSLDFKKYRIRWERIGKILKHQ